jgi:succinate dehydrogenase/fumarate reductase flavoprotein subunit
MQFETQTVNTDVLIIGGGLAGCMAAIKATEAGVRVTVVEKANTNRSGCTATGIDHLWAYIPPVHEKMGWKIEDLLEDHAQTMGYGGFIRWDLLRLIAETSYDRVLDLERFGVNFRFEDSLVPGKFRIVPQFHGVPSSFNFDGRDLKPKLTKEAKSRGVEILNRIMITDVLTRDGKVSGAVGVSIREPKVYQFQAKTVVLSSSGRLSRMGRSVLGNTFNRRLPPSGTTGDGKLIALKAGAELINTEFFGVHTPALGIKNFPMTGGGPRNTLQPAARIVGPHGEVIVPRTYFYDWNTLGKSKVSAEEGRKKFFEDAKLLSLPSKHYSEGNRPLYFDFSEGTDDEIKYIEWSMSNEGKMWILLKYFKDHGVDLKKDKIEMGPRDREASANAASGVWVDKDCESGIEGLFAAGDEIGGVPWSSGPGAVTTGWHAGMKAAEKARQIKSGVQPEKGELERIVERYQNLTRHKNGDHWLEVEYALQEIVDTYMGDETSEELLKRGLDRLSALRTSTRLWADTPHTLMRCLEVENLIENGRIIMTAARERKESRAFLKRVDYPKKNDENWFVFLGMKEDKEGKVTFSKKQITKI